MNNFNEVKNQEKVGKKQENHINYFSNEMRFNDVKIVKKWAKTLQKSPKKTQNPSIFSSNMRLFA